MSRTRLIILVLLAAGAVLLITKPFSSPGYRVDAIFDTADEITSGMQVEVAGVPVGSVVSVKLTPGLKARIEMQLTQRFAPFHVGARCRILPEGIISENYVQCDPGSPGAPALAAPHGAVPTVPLSHDTTPVSLQQFIDIFSMPVADRLQVLLNELGIATAGQGEDVNAILLRANPALTQANRVLAQIDTQRRQLASAVGQTNQVVAELAARAGSVRQFVDRAAIVTETTGQHSGPLGTAIDRLPALLTQVKLAAGVLRQTSVSGTPLLSALRAGAPALARLTTTLPRFITAALPAVHQLASVAAEGRTALTSATPVLSRLHRFATDATPAAQLLNQLLVNVRDRGGLEYAQDVVYGLGAALSPFDAISHFGTVFVLLTPCITNKTAAGCNRGWGTIASREQAAAGQVPSTANHNPNAGIGAAHPSSRPGTGSTAPSPTASAPAGAPRAPQPGGGKASPPPNQPLSGAVKALSGLLNYLVK